MAFTVAVSSLRIFHRVVDDIIHSAHSMTTKKGGQTYSCAFAQEYACGEIGGKITLHLCLWSQHNLELANNLNECHL